MTGHLVHIGFPKTGSNWLRRWFAAHPDLAFVEGGIAGCRDVYQLVREMAAPRASARWRVTSSEVFAIPQPQAGDPGADFHETEPREMAAMQDRACALLAELFPNAHVLIVTRGFRAVAQSGFSQFVRTGGDPARIAALRDGGLDRWPLERWPWNYDRVIGLYRAAFADRVLVLPYELLRDDADAFVGEIERALGLGHCPPPADRMNASLGEAELRWYPVLSRAVRALPVGARLRRAVFRRYVRALAADRLRPLVRLLDRVAPPPANPPEFDIRTIAGLRGLAESLRGNPLYAPYADDYLL